MALDPISIVTGGIRATTGSEFEIRVATRGLIGTLSEPAAAQLQAGITPYVRMKRYRTGAIFSLLLYLGILT